MKFALQENVTAAYDLCLAAPAAERRRRLDRADLLVGRFRRREDRAGGDGVDEDVVLRQLERQRLGQPDDPVLRDVVGQVALVARTAAARDPVGEVDDPPAPRARMCGHGRPRTENAALRSTFTTASQTCSSISSKATDVYTEAMLISTSSRPMSVAAPIHERPHASCLGQVGLIDEGAAARRLDRGGDLSASVRDRLNDSATSIPRPASATATAAPMRLPPVIRDALPVRRSRHDPPLPSARRRRARPAIGRIIGARR